MERGKNNNKQKRPHTPPLGAGLQESRDPRNESKTPTWEKGTGKGGETHGDRTWLRGLALQKDPRNTTTQLKD